MSLSLSPARTATPETAGDPVITAPPISRPSTGRVTAVRVASERFGEFDVEPDRVLTFDEGLPGFDDAHRFALVPVPDAHDAFYWLQSVEDPALAFLAVVPWPFFPDYEPELPETDQQLLGIGSPQDALVLCLLTVHRDDQKVTANLLGPLVVNERSRAGRQVILAEQGYPTQAILGAASA